ncbi:vitamin B6 photo-protection and homoeostasis-domain-containing protein [Crucibulum laeve]|uniref:Vitamin B6 photo-protection and homoeostasis-domain-containing protein n=1 Tax=Crucibulum laeve TaxID=68775 RepID=A0A5C3M251_9AGAR|nr:vitamin B6 photo-protection and homoeostasis-domain-containing protein [Crucibulum laeve]
MEREESIIITERDEAGRNHQIQISGSKVKREVTRLSNTHSHSTGAWLTDFMRKVFLPAGYPNSVSSDYLRYQILNALQAFCNSLASLLSSRAILEGFGVGDPSATATHALLLTALQDVFSRLTTIFAAYLIGSSLVPEAKTYRLLADVLNDAAVVLDTFSPLLNTSALPGVRVAALCVSASLRSLCGIAAGGSKAAITLHFATPSEGSGDVGDLNAKDASKETVLALLGMLLGTLIVPRLTTLWSTYSMLFVLVGLHLGINYVGVRGLVLRSLNRQRTGLAWLAYRSSNNSYILPPVEMTRRERIFDRPGVFRDLQTGDVIGHCTIGSSIAEISQTSIPSRFFSLFDQERYVLWYDKQCLLPSTDKAAPAFYGCPRLHICLKEGYTYLDQLKAWTHAAELCRAVTCGRTGDVDRIDGHDALGVLEASYQQSVRCFSDFVEKLRAVGWNTVDGALMTGSPNAVLTGIETSVIDDSREEKKHR